LAKGVFKLSLLLSISFLQLMIDEINIKIDK